jgi:hypothetical protein
MFFDQPMVICSKQEDGRHWFTTMDLPPLQIWPVAPNHHRVGHFLATLISAKLAGLESEVPEEMVLSRADVASVPSLASRYPELKGEAADVQVRLVPKEAPKDLQVDEDEEDGPMEFVTPQPPLDWQGDYDSWITTAGRRLGIDVAPASGKDGYERAMADAVAQVQGQLPALRQRFLAGMEGLNLGFKVALLTKKGGKEYVWVRATDWKEEGTLVCVLENQPRDCKGYQLGQTLQLPIAELLDYAIGSETAGVVDPGLTQRIAEDYGMVLR